MSSSSSPGRDKRRLELIIVLAVFTLIIAGLVYHLRYVQVHMVGSAALQSAKTYVNAVLTNRHLYTEEVVAKVRRHGIEVFHGMSGGIPLPITYTKLFSEALAARKSDVSVGIYSPFPMNDREQSGLRDEFARQAWDQLNKQPEIPFYTLAFGDAHNELRYAVADVLQEECVACHNQHPDASKSDWQVGDVRGVIEVRMSLDSMIDAQQNDFWAMTLLLGGIGIFIAVGVIIWIRRYRKYSEDLADAVKTRTAELKHEVEQHKNTESRLEFSEAHIRGILDTAYDGIITLDAKGKVQIFNSAAEKIFGYKREEIVGQSIDLLIPKTSGLNHNEKLRHYQHTGEAKILGVNREVLAQRKDGSVFPIELAVSEMRSDGSPTYIGVLRDISERKQEEKELVAAKEKAERESQAKTVFLSRMSHEFRTPLNAILGLGQLLEMDSQTDVQKDYSREVVHAGQHLLALVNDVLDLAKIESGRLEVKMEPVAVDVALKECRNMINPLAKKRNVNIMMPRPEALFVKADPVRLKQVLLNLLSNAVKYNEDEGRIEISVRKCGEKTLRINVFDTGSGMSVQQLSRLFHPFERVGAQYSTREGAGIGLVISKNLVELMGGRIGVESSPGKGSTFWIELPRA